MTAKEKKIVEEDFGDVSRNDKSAILILFVLYAMQSIPHGISQSVQLILQRKNVSYSEQAMFSVVSWPFSFKLLWAPFVDSVYWKYLGRRKTWLIGVLYALGIFMIILSSHISYLLGDVEGSSSPNVLYLSVIFFIMVFLCATQDIAVDGWALTMLSRQNVRFATVCNSAGWKAGFFLGHILFLIFESPEFCNQYLRSVPNPEGFFTLSGFLKVNGIVFLILTTTILIFKSESQEKDFNILGVKDTLIQLYQIVCLKNVQLLLSFLMTFQIAVTAAEAVSRLKFIEAGLRTDSIALLEIPLTILGILLPLYVCRYTAGVNPLLMFLKTYPYKLMFNIVFAILVWWTFYLKVEFSAFPNYYYSVMLLCLLLHQALITCIHISVGSFLNKVSDPAIGGTYMTMLNTFLNLGRHCSSTVALWLVDMLTFKKCGSSSYNCDSTEEAAKCSAAGHSCSTYIDGFYVESVGCVIFGFLWLRWGRKTVKKLHGTVSSDWKISQYSKLQNVESGSLSE